jgi:hypothetical protein
VAPSSTAAGRAVRMDGRRGHRCVVGRGRASLSINFDAHHSQPGAEINFMNMDGGSLGAFYTAWLTLVQVRRPGALRTRGKA